MRIAFIVGRFPALSETFILNQITGLIDRGHEVDIYALDGSSRDNSRVHGDVGRYHLLDRTYVQEMPANYFLRLLKGLGLLSANCHKDPLGLLRSLNVFRYPRQSASLRLLYSALLLHGKGPYDIVHCQFGTLGLWGMALRSIGALGGKLVVSFRGYDVSAYIRRRGNGVYNQLFHDGTFFLANCEYFKRRLVELGCDEMKVAVHRSGIDCRRFAYTPRRPHPDGRVRLVMTGRLKEKKGVEYSIRAFEKLARVSQRIEYTVIGNGPLREDLQCLVQELKLGHMVKLAGQKTQEEIIDILNDSHIFVAPSVTGRDGDQDAPINSLKEAMAMGLPVVSTLHGGIPELVQDGISGFLVPERDVDALAERLKYLIEHPQVWPEMGRAGRAYVEEHYDANKLNDDLVETYQRLLG